MNQSNLDFTKCILYGRVHNGGKDSFLGWSRISHNGLEISPRALDDLGFDIGAFSTLVPDRVTCT